jgi:sugar lactone lactonase YvrE
MRDQMRFGSMVGVVVVAAGIAMAATPAARVRAQAGGPSVKDLPNPYRAIDNWGQLPGGRKIGAASAIDIDRDGTSVWVYERCGGKGGSKKNPTFADNCVRSKVEPLLHFDASGKLLASYGAGMFEYPHGIGIDADGNIWVADGQGRDIQLREPGKGHQVLGFSPSGKVLLRLGKPGTPGDGQDVFNQPSDVLVAANGDIFVGDGHGGKSNARIVKFSKDGKFIKAWGTRGSGPGQFHTAHSLAMDSQGRLFVSDRGNDRIQIFDREGTFLAEWKQFGNPNGIYIDRHDRLYSLGTAADGPRGLRVGSARDGMLMAFFPDLDPNPDGYVGGQEGLAVDRDGNVYISRTGPGGLMKLVRTSTSR